MLKKFFLIMLFLSLSISAHPDEIWEEVFISCPRQASDPQTPWSDLNDPYTSAYFLDGIIENEEQYFDQIFKSHEFLINHLPEARDLLLPDKLKDYNEKLKSIRRLQPGLSEFEYMEKIDRAMASKIKSTAPFLAQTYQCIYPKIDFSKEVLVAVSLSTGGCESPVVEKKVELDPKNQIYKIKVRATQQGRCKRAWYVSFIVKVLKPPSGYRIEVEKEVCVENKCTLQD